MQNHFHSVQALRGIAATLVAIFHFFPTQFVVGAAGVDLFFVISGFIMGTIGVNDRPLRFLSKRAIRIAPLYWLFTFAMCAGAIAGVYSNFTFDAVRLIKSLLFIPYWDETGHTWPLMVVGWTLNLEVFFYIVFAIGISFGRPILFTAATLLAMVFLGYGFETSNAAFTLWTSNLLLEFVAGLLLSRFSLGEKFAVPAVVIGVAALITTNVFSLFDPSYRILVWGVPAVLIVAGCLAIERMGNWSSPVLKPVQKVGDASYSLYLSHAFFAAAVHKFFGTAFLPSALGVAAAIVGAVAIFHLVEKPLIKFLKRPSIKLPTPSQA
ncbi:acyltransferase family protein [Agrobacterium larrymoorei]|uniref:Acyltransferase n=1 Tax=Agrobacterium larrymoorei TaxID=160699 RepID=A0ABX8T1I7_9HYPH|nr:acyltransferase [Agrobacterium larrymoorei]QYA06436.1 acyltransferase [Agrobacterium larrymoorei]